MLDYCPEGVDYRAWLQGSAHLDVDQEQRIAVWRQVAKMRRKWNRDPHPTMPNEVLQEAVEGRFWPDLVRDGKGWTLPYMIGWSLEQ
jgi:hypothetical protein